MWNICSKAEQPLILISVEDAVPEGYAIEGETSNPNYLTDSAPPASGTKITRLAFRNRFTTNEKVALDMASIDNPSATTQARQVAAMLRVYLKDLENATFVDLTRADTIAGVNSLAALGVLAANRPAAILSLTISPEEVPST